MRGYPDPRRNGVNIRAASRTACTAFILLLGAGTFLLTDAAAQPESSDAASPELDASFRLFPAPLWSRSAGFAAGVGFEVENSLRPYDRLLVAAKPGQHLGRYSATYFAGDPARQALYGLANVYFETTGRRWYYGAGPASSMRDRIAVEKRMIEAELRGGIQVLGRRLFLQPSWAFHRQDVRDVRNWDERALMRLSAASLRHLDAASGSLPGTSALQRGISYGTAAGLDLRDRPYRPRRGVLLQASMRRFRFQEPGNLRFERYAVGAYGYLPLRGGVLSLRTLLELTEADGDVTLPFYFLPSLDGRTLPGYAIHRFFGNDLFALTVEYAVPLFQFANVVALDALFSAGAGSVYDDISEQFEARISFDDVFDDGAGAYPLRPSAATGIALESDARGWDVRILLGWGTEGLRLVKFGFVHDVQGIELNKR